MPHFPSGRFDHCPCGSGRRFAACCERLLCGEPAATAEALMRSRYTAYVVRDSAYLLRTWHPSTRPDRVDAEEGPQWLALEITAIRGGGADDEAGSVEFRARFRDGVEVGGLRERSRFIREAGAWFYLGGEYVVESERKKVGRNDPCPCGSGRKSKRCCIG